MMIISLKDSNLNEREDTQSRNAKRIKLDPIESTTIDCNSEGDDDSNSSFGSEYSLSSSTMNLNQTADSGNQEVKVKRKRQRLTHLTHEEKIMRRKLKNRVAAQNARDRKKAKMDELDVSVTLLREQNEKLKLENGLLKEQNKLLGNENKLLKQKLANLQNCAGVTVEVERSAVSSYETLPRLQLQQQQNAIMQKLIYVLIIHILSLIKVTNKKSPLYTHLVQMKNYLIQLDQQHRSLPANQIVYNPKLKVFLLKLLKLMKVIRNRYYQQSFQQQQQHNQHQPQFIQPCQNQLVPKINNNSIQQQRNLTQDQMKIMLLISLVVKCLMKKSKN